MLVANELEFVDASFYWRAERLDGLSSWVISKDMSARIACKPDCGFCVSARFLRL